TVPLQRYFFFIPRRPRPSTLFPYTTLFRSDGGRPLGPGAADADGRDRRAARRRHAHLQPHWRQGDRLPDDPASRRRRRRPPPPRSEEHTSELQSLRHLVCRLLLEKKK